MKGALQNIADVVSEIDAAEVTVREQAYLEQNPEDLRWTSLMPRANKRSIKIASITNSDFRPVADRREWNSTGRYIPMRDVKVEDLEITPIEAFFRYDERFMQLLMGENANRIDLAIEAARAALPARWRELAEACHRRVEIDTFDAARTGIITARDPRTGTVTNLEFIVDAARRQAAGAAWTDENAWDNFEAASEDAFDALGGLSGVTITRQLLRMLLRSAPVPVLAGFRQTKENLQSRMEDVLGTPFMFKVDRRQLDVFDGTGNAYTRTPVWNGTEILFHPPGGVVGEVAHAPVFRAQQMAGIASDTTLDQHGVTCFYEVENGGRSLKIEAQLNATPVPDEAKIYTYDAGV